MSAPFSFSQQTDPEAKRSYAAALLRTQGANRFFEAAVMVVGNNISAAMWIANNWPNDPIVIAETQRILRSDTLKDDVPSKAQMTMRAWAMANDDTIDSKNAIAALRLAAELEGHIGGSGVNVTVPVNLGNNVMVVKDHGTDDQWEAMLAAQQDALTNASAAKPH